MISNLANDAGTTNPSLKKYFKYMVNSRKLTIQFTQGKIREIIQTDLNIDFNSFSVLLKAVSTEAFAFYIQGWPGWQPSQFQQCIDNTEESYKKFKQYLRDKILQLKDKEKNYIDTGDGKNDATANGYTITPPGDSYQQLPADFTNYKVKLPYTLEISAKPNLLNMISFQSWGGETYLHIKSPEIAVRDKLTNIEALNHPFVSVQFKMPLLIKFTRKNVHRIEMFLCRPTDTWKFPRQEHILDIRKFPSRSSIYTTKFLQELFNKLIAIIDGYCPTIQLELRDEIFNVCKEFLNDICEANLNFSTVQECSEVCFSIGGSVYYNDSAKNKEAAVNLRKIYSPQVLYSLVYCSIRQSDVNPDGSFKYFDFVNQKTRQENQCSSTELEFINNLQNSLHYSCLMCTVHYTSISELKKHLLSVHSTTEILVCTKCKQEGYVYELMNRRWAHECNAPSSEPQKKTT